MNFITEYKDFFDKRFVENEKGSTDTVGYWRDQLFSYLMMIIIPIGFIAYIPSIYMAYVMNNLVIIAVDTLAMLYLFFIIFTDFISIKTKKFIFFIIIYLMTASLLLYLGPYGPGLIYLAANSIFILLLYSQRVAFYSIALNFILTFIPIFGLYFGTFSVSLNEDYNYIAILTFNANFMFLNIVTVIGVSIIINGLNKKIKTEMNLIDEIRNNNIKLKNAKEKAEASDRLKSAFLANMSHEIRTPLNAIIGFSSLIKDDDLTIDERDEFIKTIELNGKRLLNIMSNIIDISKIDSKNEIVDETEFDVIELIKYIYDENKYLAPKKLEFKTAINIDKDKISVLGDMGKIKQIINNFISNAFKYTQMGFIELGLELNDEGKFVFYVQDTGIGIKDEIINRIFDRFYQIDDFYDGTGLGLSICKSLSEIIGAEIKVHSEIGLGTTFSLEINLPMVTKSSENGDFTINAKDTKILIAEDHNDNYLLLNTLLNRMNLSSDRAVNGIIAVEMAQKIKYDIIFMDIKMPYLSGTEALKEIRKHDNHSKIIAVTAYAFDSDKESLLKEGFDDYLPKPVNLNLLKEKLSDYV